MDDVAKAAIVTAAKQATDHIDGKISHLEKKVEAAQAALKDLKENREKLINQQVKRTVDRLNRAGINIEVPTAELNVEGH